MNYQFYCLISQEHYTPFIEKHDVLSEVIHLAASCVKSLHLKLVGDVINDWNTTIHLKISTSKSMAILSCTEIYYWGF